MSAKSNQLIFWEINFSIDSAAMIEHKIQLSKLNAETMNNNIVYDVDGNLFVANCSGNVWQVVKVTFKSKNKNKF